MDKPSLPKGTRDFGPLEMARRNHIFQIIRETFELFGFGQLETPSMENLSVLTGKYGDEGDQLIFKILNSGNFSEKLADADWSAGYKALTPKISEKALRYDLTVPFARYVVMNRGQLTFPFKRYQMQPVWRADRPQKGRYREFFQCDADVIGTDSLLGEAEIILMIDRVLTKLGLDNYTIKINHRLLLAAIAQAAGIEGQEARVAVAIDKLDKIGWEGVSKELSSYGYDNSIIEKLQALFSKQVDLTDYSQAGGLSSQLSHLLTTSIDSPAVKAESDLSTFAHFLSGFSQWERLTSEGKLQLDLSLARGLSYYTGLIFEVKINDAQMGSISGGGRYDNLTGVFGVSGLSGVGFSFGVDRIYDVMLEKGLFESITGAGVRVMFTHYGPTLSESLSVLAEMRANGISAEIYPEDAKLGKQFDYAGKKGTPYAVIIREDEAAKGTVQLKTLGGGTQVELMTADCIKLLTAKS